MTKYFRLYENASDRRRRLWARPTTDGGARTSAQPLQGRTGASALSCAPEDPGAARTLFENGRAALKMAFSRRSTIRYASSASSTIYERHVLHRAIAWRPPQLAALRRGALLAAAAAVVVTFPILRPCAAIERQRDGPASNAGVLSPDRDTTSLVPTNAPASPPPGAGNRSDAETHSAWALLPQHMPTRVLIRYLASSAEARRRAEGLAKTLTAQDVEVVDVREGAAPVRTALYFSYVSDLAIARRIGRIAGLPPVRAATTKDGLTARPGLLQLSISGS